MFKTKEVARNPNPEVKVSCVNCRKKYSIINALQERPLKIDYGAIVEGVLICPHCHFVKHVYYMTDHLRNEQRILKELAREWQATQDNAVFKKLEAKQIAYRNEYDRVQEKYSKEFSHGSDQK